jgi:HEPN domain-containing protein
LPKHDLRDLADRYARKARSDEIALEKFGEDDEVPDDLIGFHAQQAVEKLLKAALASVGVAPPRVHDIRGLAKMLEDAGLALPDAVAEARRLTPWAVEFRYEDIIEGGLDRVVTSKTVAEVRSWVDGLLGADKAAETEEA